MKKNKIRRALNIGVGVLLSLALALELPLALPLELPLPLPLSLSPMAEVSAGPLGAIYVVGDTRLFNNIVDRTNLGSVDGVLGRLVAQHGHANIWVLDDDAYHAATRTAHSASCDMFDMGPEKAQRFAIAADGIYRRMTDPDIGTGAHAGLVYQNVVTRHGDIDNDGMINFLFYPNLASGYPAGRDDIDVLHIAMNGIAVNSDSYFYGHMAHEFQHLLNDMYLPVSMNSWITENLCEYANVFYSHQELEVSLRITGAVVNKYANDTDEIPMYGNQYSDFFKFGALKGYSMAQALSLYMAKTVGRDYAHRIFEYFKAEYPPAADQAQLNANLAKIGGRSPYEIWGDALESLGIGSGGMDSLSAMYWMFMESFGADGGTVRGIDGDRPTVKLASGASASENLWSSRHVFNNYTWPYPTIASGGAIELNGYGEGMQHYGVGVTHEKFYKLVPAPGSSTALTINISDAAAGDGTKYYVALKRADGNGANLPNADIYPLAPGTPRTILTEGDEAFLFVATFDRSVASSLEYSWGAAPVALAAPANLRVTSQGTDPNASQITVAWDATPGADSYDVYRDGALAGSVISPTSFVVSGLSAQTTYSFYVRAKNADGASPGSNTVYGTTPPLMPAPTNLRVTGQTESTISLAWDAAPGASGYTLYRNGVAFGGTSPGTSAAFFVQGLSAGTTYSFNVSAYYLTDDLSISFSPNSNAAYGTTSEAPALAAPANLRVATMGTSAASSYVSLAWDASEGAKSYDVYQDGVFIGSAASPASPVSPGSPQASYVVQWLGAQTTYSFYVRARDSAGGASPGSNTVTATTPGLFVPPENLRIADRTASSITIAWDMVPGAFGYTVFKDGAQIGGVSSGAHTTFTAEGLTDVTTYSFYVTAYTIIDGLAVSHSPNSETVYGTTLTIPAPSNLRVTGQTATTVSLAWDISAGAASYIVYCNDAQVGGVSPGIITSFTVAGLNPNTTYQFYVRACPPAGRLIMFFSDKSNLVPGTTSEMLYY